MPIYQCICPEGLLDQPTREAIALSQMWARLTGQAEGELLISLWENPPENVMEAGLIFPALGQEEQWFEENRAPADRAGHSLKNGRYRKAPMPVISRPTMSVCMVSVPSKV
jgi:hypothetical protein